VRRLYGCRTWTAVTAEQAARLEDIYAHRHDLIHELARYLIDPDLEPDFDLFIEALKTLRGISRFWTEVEAGYGTFDDFPDLDLDEVINGRVAPPRPLHTRVRGGPDRVTGNGSVTATGCKGPTVSEGGWRSDRTGVRLAGRRGGGACHPADPGWAADPRAWNRRVRRDPALAISWTSRRGSLTT
jgi:hypothetical protein